MTTGRIQRTEEEMRTRPVNRLQTMYPIRAYADEMYARAEQKGKEGRPIAWCMFEPFTKHIFNVMDVETIFTENYAGICANDDAAIPYIDRAVADGFPGYLCGYLTNIFGYAGRMQELDYEIPPEAPRGGIAKPILLLDSSMGCDARAKGYSGLGRYLGAAVYTLDCPTPGQREGMMPGAYEHEVKTIVQNLRDFIEFMEHLLGTKLDYDKLDEDVSNHIKLDAVWFAATDELRTARPGPVNSRDHFACMTSLFFNPSEPERLLELVQNMYDETKHRVDNGISGINREEKYRMSFSGLGPWANMNLLDMWADKGWNFVREGYHPPDPIDVSSVTDPVEKIVRYRYQGLERSIDNSFSPEEAAEVKKEVMDTGFSHRANPGISDAKNYQLDGVIQYCNFSCRPTATSTSISQYQLMEAYKVPSLIVEADMIDKRVLDVDDLLKRCEAFEETMDHYKEERKNLGMPW